MRVIALPKGYELAQGIGIRFGHQDARVLAIDESGEGYKVTAIAPAVPHGDIASFLLSRGFSFEQTTTAFGLVPGDFLTVTLTRNNGMDIPDIMEQLTWEIERRLLTPASDYTLDFAFTEEAGFVFACRKKLIEETIPRTWKAVADVEPVALLNGCEASGELADETVMLISIEPEGISSVVVNGAVPYAFESFPVRDLDTVSFIESLSGSADGRGESTLTQRITDAVLQSVKRLTSLGEDTGKPAPRRFILAGSGAYAGDVAGALEAETGIPASISNPFGSIIIRSDAIDPHLAEKSAAFTTCFGLALRAMEA